jgi:hypothetical protein
MGLYQFNEMGCVDLEDVTRKSYRLAVAKRYPEADPPNQQALICTIRATKKRRGDSQNGTKSWGGWRCLSGANHLRSIKN